MKNEILKLKLENTRLKNEKEQYKKRIEELIKIKDLNSPEAKKIINSLINY